MKFRKCLIHKNGGAAMKKSGGKPTDTILTLEEALRRFARKLSEESASTTDETHADSSATVTREGDGTAAGDLRSAEDGANAYAQPDEANAGMSAGEDVVAPIDGVPRPLEEIEQMVAADEDAEFGDGSEVGEAGRTARAARHFPVGDYAFTAISAALALLVALLITRVPIGNNRPNLVAQTSAMPAPLKASPLTSADEQITNFVMIPVAGAHLASAGPTLKSDELEALIKDMLKSHAFPDMEYPCRRWAKRIWRAKFTVWMRRTRSRKSCTASTVCIGFIFCIQTCYPRMVPHTSA